MKEVNGWWLPDEEIHIKAYFDAIKQDQYQPVHQKTAVEYCTNFRKAVDIGAHVGLWARSLTEKFQEVVCFEPCDDFSELLVLNAPKITTLHRCALGDKQGTVKLEIEASNTGATHVARGATGNIPMRTLDSFNLNDVDFVKIDVEGFELEVIKGGYETLKRNNPVIIVEQKDRYVVPEQGPHAAVRFLMRELQYRVIDRVVDDWILRKL
jgi:FkbM family methyltransferase